MRFILAFAAILVIGFSGCTKKSSGSSSSATGTMTASIGGTGFNSTHCYESSSGDYYVIIANSGSTTISISIKSNNIAATTYNFDNSFANHYAVCTVNSVVKNSRSGSVTFTAINPGVSFIGTFSFTSEDGTVVSGGVFTAVL